ncbi:MAG: glutamine--tRNA ligase/YqeY domain fusion protein [Deltaproteobacteria bacterium]|nr:glutamine--tRNA ligase/YqeY domain fusion protein [Deltaproteobacteria bacterium]
MSDRDPAESAAPRTPGLDFIRQRVTAERAEGKNEGRVHTRFPPEPNGYLHVGHAKSICLNFGIASEFGGLCNLRFDDTNPVKEDTEYVESIKRDVRWLGFDWADREYYASDYFGKIHDCAVELIEKRLAYIDSSTAEELRAMRGTLTEPGKNSPYRERGVAENLDLFARMRAGEFADGAHVLRAKIDMTSPNINLRDPALFRIRKVEHHRTGDAWCIYPMYDFAHAISDALEHITHSICTLEFEDHRPLYDWCIENLTLPSRPEQIEFARLNLTYTVMSKRKLLELVRDRHVSGWDDPRMPTLAGMRRRGVPPAALRDFCARIGLAKKNATIDVGQLEFSIRDELNRAAPRVMAVLRPLKLVIESWEEGRVEQMDAVNNPEDASAGTRKVPFARELWIEQDDFREDPPKKFFRLAPGAEVRLRYGYIVKCTGVVKNDAGEVVEVRCTHDPGTRSGMPDANRKVKGTIHWVSAAHAVQAEVRLYDRLFRSENPEEAGSFLADLNPDSLEVVADARVEPSVAAADAGSRVQFERLGYFAVDPDATPAKPVFNRIVTLRDTWAKIAQSAQTGQTGKS